MATQAALGALQQQLTGYGMLHMIRLPRETMFLLDGAEVDSDALWSSINTLIGTLRITLQTAIHVGISRLQPGIPGLQLAAQEAETALSAAIRRERPVMLFEDISQDGNVDRMFFNRLSTLYDLTQSGSYESALELAEELSLQPGAGTQQTLALAINSAASAVRLESPEQEVALRKLLELPTVLNQPEELQEYASRVFGQLAVSTTQGNSEQDTRVLQYLQANFTDPQLSIADLARQLSLSQSTLSRITMRAVGMTPLDYIQRLRMDRAKELLHQGLSVGDVALQVGCTNTAALRRIFKKFENTTPAAFTK